MSVSEELKKWARHEVDLVKIGERLDLDPQLNDHYEAAYLLFDKFVDYTSALKSPGAVKAILLQLLNKEPLTPIEDGEDDWVLVRGYTPTLETQQDDSPWEIYEHKRRSTLFKRIIYNCETGLADRTDLSDSERCICIDVNDPNNMYTGGIGQAILDEMIPITMPYMPLGKIKIFTEGFKYNDKFEGGCDTRAVLYFRMPDGEMKQVKRFFKQDHVIKDPIEITEAEYFARKKEVMSRYANNDNE